MENWLRSAVPAVPPWAVKNTPASWVAVAPVRVAVVDRAVQAVPLVE